MLKSDSDSGGDLSTLAEIALSLNVYFQSHFVKDETIDDGIHHSISIRIIRYVSSGIHSITEKVLDAMMMENRYSNLNLFIKKLINWKITRLSCYPQGGKGFCKATVAITLHIIFQKSFSEENFSI